MGGKDTRRPLITNKSTRFCLVLAFLIFDAGASAEPLSVLTQNLNRFYDDVDNGMQEKVLSKQRFRQRVTAAAKKFGNSYGLPHIIALQEVENLNVLNQIAAEMERRYDTRYRPVLLPGHDPSAINLAYLLRYELEIRKVEQLFRVETFGAGAQALFSRPPLYLEACYLENCLSLLNLHLRSMRGIDSAASGERVRRKRLAQAESVARWSNRLQNSKTGISLLILGDLNALTPADEHVDVAGVIRGNPDNRSRRLHGPDLVQPDLVDLTLLIPPQKRYSFVFRRRKQQLDYMLINRSFAADVVHIGFGRIDSRFSDHAGLLALFSW